MRPASSCMLAAAAVAGLCWHSSVAAKSCSATATGVNFGNYDPQSGVPDDAPGTLSLECNGGGRSAFATVSLGTGNSGNFASRSMGNGASFLQYNLYADSARAIVWGDGSGGTSTVDVPVNFGLGSRTIYGRIPSGQMVSAGAYSDLIVVTIDF